MAKVLKPNTLKVIRDRYFLRDPKGTLLESTWEEPCTRVGNFVSFGHLSNYRDPRELFRHPELLDSIPTTAKEERTNLAAEFSQMHIDQVFAANSPTWFNAANPFAKWMLSACFILHVPDDIEGIFQAIQDGAVIGKYGGGIGMDFSQIRPRNSYTNSGGYASGALSFMGPFQAMSEAIVQGGRRRIAMMAMLGVWHPEILMFIDCKEKTGPERESWLIKRYGLSFEDARDIMTGVNWLKVKNKGTPLEQDDWITPFCGFNISVKISDEFMSAVANDDLFMLRRAVVEDPENGPRAKKIHYEPWRGPVFDPRNTDDGGNILENRDGLVVDQDGVKYIKARELWYGRLMPAAHQSAEPGIMFDDNVNVDNPVKSLGPIHNSNPCGEYYQVDGNSCNLGSLNLSKFFIKTPPRYIPERDWVKHIDWIELAAKSRLGTRFLDCVITMNEYPIQMITDTTAVSRPVGLGDMGFADLLVDMQIEYGSPLSVKVAEAVQQWIQYWSWIESTRLAEEFGPFSELENNRPYFDEKMERLTKDLFLHPAYFPTIPNLFDEYRMHGVRNAHVTVIAPTGTIALMDECSHSVEPITFLAFRRQDTVGVRWYFYDRAFDYLKEKYGSTASTDLAGDDLASFLFENYAKELPRYFKAANDVTPEEHIAIQAAFQKYCDNAISKTCNMPNSATVEQVAKIYDLAHKSGLKGCTVYRDGSRHGVMVEIKKKAATVAEPEVVAADAPENLTVKSDTPIDLPEFLHGGRWRIPDGRDGKMYIHVDHLNGKIVEVFIRENSGNEWTELTGRLLSLLLRSNVPDQDIRQQLRRVQGQATIFYAQKQFTSPVQVVDHVVFEQARKYFSSPTHEHDMIPAPLQAHNLKALAGGLLCPKCGDILQAESGCFNCPNPECGYSKCK